MDSVPIICNIKVHFHVRSRKKLIKKLKKITEGITWYHNYVMLRNRFIYTIFWNSGFINATGIKCKSHIKKAVKHFMHLFHFSRKKKRKIIIDNITASGNYNCNINLRQFTSMSFDKHVMSIKWNRCFFPACFLRVYKHGTLTLFSTGKYNIIGSRTEESVNVIYKLGKTLIQEWITAYIQKPQPIMNKDMKAALIVAL